jgi:hypothetical protein
MVFTWDQFIKQKVSISEIQYEKLWEPYTHKNILQQWAGDSNCATRN